MNLKLMEVVSDIDHMSEEDVKKGIACSYVKDWLYVLHDKDIYTGEDEKKNSEHVAGTPKKPHWHVFLRLKDSTDTKYIAEKFGIAENFVGKVKGKWVDVLLYATHRNALEKYQYSDEEVVSNFNFSEVRDKEEKKKNENIKINEILDKIDSGEIREYNYTKYIGLKDYVKYERQIKRAFEYRIQKQKGAERDMRCIFIVGDSGCGKTTYAKQIAKEKNYSYYISSGSNDVLDDYKGEDCIILDDLRPSCLGLSDLLKMLDNNTASSVKSRFKNKVLECKLIIITTTLDIATFFKNVFSEETETIVQLKRRCEMYIHMTLDKMIVSVYQPQLRDYVEIAEYENPVAFMYKAKDRTEEECFDFIENLLGSTLTGVKKIRKMTEEQKEQETFVSPFDGQTYEDNLPLFKYID